MIEKDETEKNKNLENESNGSLLESLSDKMNHIKAFNNENK
jgi:hypothetical protein